MSDDIGRPPKAPPFEEAAGPEVACPRPCASVRDLDLDAAMVTTDKARRLSDADRAGYQARSPEGHAARGMSIRGQEDAWIRIQESAKTEGYFFKHFMPFLGGEGVKISCCKLSKTDTFL